MTLYKLIYQYQQQGVKMNERCVCNQNVSGDSFPSFLRSGTEKQRHKGVSEGEHSTIFIKGGFV